MFRLGSTIMPRPEDSMAKAAAAGSVKRSFQGYTTDAAPALIGFGASAIGSLPQGYVQNVSAAAAYGREIEEGRLAAVRGVALTADDRLRRDLIERLMCDLVVDIEAIAGAHDADPAPLIADAAEGIDRFVEDGLCFWDGSLIAVTNRVGRSCGPSPPFLTSTCIARPTALVMHGRCERAANAKIFQAWNRAK